MSCPHHGSRQRGMAMIVTLILLVVATIISMASFRLSLSDFKIAGNMQSRAQTAAVAQQAIEEAISSTRFFKEPDAVYPSPCPGEGQNTFCSDVNGDRTNDVVVTLTPQPVCTVAWVRKSAELDLRNPEDLGCTVGVQQNFGTIGAASDSSLCAFTIWQIRAEAVDRITETRVAITQGVGVQVASTDMASNCPE